MTNRRFEILLLKNTVAIAIPAIAVFLVLIFMFTRYPVFDQIRCSTIGNVENIGARMEEMYELGTTNVEYTAQDLYYTGFDYYVDGKIKGAYYYGMQQEQLIMFLVKTDEPALHIDEITLKGKIVKDSMTTEHILNRFAGERNMDYELLKNYGSAYIISEPDYPYAYAVMVYVFFFSPIVICVLIFIYTLFAWINPSVHSQARQLEAYGDVAAIIDDLNSQLKNRLLFKKNNIYITADYMVVSYITKTDVIRLEYIKYLSKNPVEMTGFLHRNETVYRLTMSNPEKMFYEVDFANEELIDDVVEYIRGVSKPKKNLTV